MRRRPNHLLVVFWAGLAVVAGPSAAAHARSLSVRNLDPNLQRLVACMVRTAKQVPGVDHVQLTLTDSQSSFNGGERWVHPLISYRAREKTGDSYIVTFDTARSNASGSYEYSFLADLPGLSSPGQMPSDWKSGEVIGLWRTRCHAEASAVFS